MKGIENMNKKIATFKEMRKCKVELKCHCGYHNVERLYEFFQHRKQCNLCGNTLFIQNVYDMSDKLRNLFRFETQIEFIISYLHKSRHTNYNYDTIESFRNLTLHHPGLFKCTCDIELKQVFQDVEQW